MELEYTSQQKEQEEYLEELNNKFQRLSNDIDFKTKYKFEIFNNRIRSLKLDSTSKKKQWKFLCDNFECSKKAIKNLCTYHQNLEDNPDTVISIEFLEKLNEKLKKMVNEENLKQKPKYKFHIINDKIRRTLIETGTVKTICYNWNCYSQISNDAKYCKYHKNLIVNPPQIISQELKNSLEIKLQKLINIESLSVKIKYNYKICNNKIKKKSTDFNNSQWITICDYEECNTGIRENRNYCDYHQRILIDKPIPEELLEELKDLQDINLNPEFKDIQFKINCHHINGDIYRILKKTINSNTFIPICLHKYCINCCNFNFEEETTRLYCGEHKLVGMINLDSRKCINILDDGTRCKIGISDNKKYNRYCINCYYNLPENKDKIRILNRGVKESYVVDFIKSNYDNKEIKEKYNIIDIIYDKYCGTTKKKPDIVFICKDNVIVLEIDENQHKGHSYDGGLYSKENEEKKMKLIREHYQKKDKKTIYLRFNPDDYKTKNNKKIKSPWSLDEDKKLIVIDENDWNNRLKILKQKVDFYLKKKEIKNNSTIYLFYDN